MAQREGGRHWFISTVVVPVVCVIVSVTASLVAVSAQNAKEDNQARLEALATHQAALTRFKFAVQGLRHARTDRLSERSSMLERDAEGRIKEGSAYRAWATTGAARVTVAAREVSETGVEFVATYDAAAPYFDDVPHVRHCSARLRLMAARLIPLGSLEEVPLRDTIRVFDQQPIEPGGRAVSEGGSDYVDALTDMGEAIIKATRDDTDTSDVCRAVADLTHFGGADLPPLGD